MKMKPFGAASALALVLTLAACAGALEAPLAHATPAATDWPPLWQDDAQRMPWAQTDFTPPRFAAPTASHCHRAPTTRELSTLSLVPPRTTIGTTTATIRVRATAAR